MKDFINNNTVIKLQTSGRIKTLEIQGFGKVQMGIGKSFFESSANLLSHNFTEDTNYKYAVLTKQDALSVI